MTAVVIVNGSAAALSAGAALYAAYTAGAVRENLPDRAVVLMMLAVMNVAFVALNMFFVVRAIVEA